MRLLDSCLFLFALAALGAFLVLATILLTRT